MDNLIEQFFYDQIDSWPLARENYDQLRAVEQRTIMFGEFPVVLQWNPARIRSTAAKVDSASISQRPCFLCRDNRPDEQIVDESLVPDYDFLVNPFPIFPFHYTISCREHCHQDNINLRTMAEFAIEHPELVAFYNGSKSGASAPDHLHFQAGNKEFLPLCDYIDYSTARIDVDFFPLVVRTYHELPMKFLHITLQCDDDEALQARLDTIDALCADKAMRNIFMLVKKEGFLEVLLFPRISHRPSCYFLTGENQMLVSPGAVDMAGVIILPREEDFDKITKEDVVKIYSEVGFDDNQLHELSQRII